MKDILHILTAVAREHLGIPNLEARRRDSLDFHEVAVWQVSTALKAAFDADATTEATSRRLTDPVRRLRDLWSQAADRDHGITWETLLFPGLYELSGEPWI